MPRFANWLETNSKLIAVIKDLVTIFAAVVAVISVCIALAQLKTTAANIKSSTIYQISHEERDIARGITPNMPDGQIGPVVSFIYTVWYQHQLGTYDDQLWGPFTEEVCQFIKNQTNFESYWQRGQKLFSTEFGNFIGERRKQCVS